MGTLGTEGRAGVVVGKTGSFRSATGSSEEWGAAHHAAAHYMVGQPEVDTLTIDIDFISSGTDDS